MGSNGLAAEALKTEPQEEDDSIINGEPATSLSRPAASLELIDDRAVSTREELKRTLDDIVCAIVSKDAQSNKKSKNSDQTDMSSCNSEAKDTVHGHGAKQVAISTASTTSTSEGSKMSCTNTNLKCPICIEKFDHDLSAYNHNNKCLSNLPVSSMACVHKICCTCLNTWRAVEMSKFASVSANRKPPKWMKCPICKVNTAFNAIDMPVDIFACTCISEIARLGAKVAATT